MLRLIILCPFTFPFTLNKIIWSTVNIKILTSAALISKIKVKISVYIFPQVTSQTGDQQLHKALAILLLLTCTSHMHNKNMHACMHRYTHTRGKGLQAVGWNYSQALKQALGLQVLLMLDGTDGTGRMTEEWSGLGDRVTTAVPPCWCTQPQGNKPMARLFILDEAVYWGSRTKPDSTVHVKHKFLINTWADLCNVPFLAIPHG